MAFKSDSIKKLPNPNILNGAVVSSDENDGYAEIAVTIIFVMILFPCGSIFLVSNNYICGCIYIYIMMRTTIANLR